jgi:hypothetical protein
MFKKITPRQVTNAIKQFPHCDAKVLHAPGECRHCDTHPEWQQLRQTWGIAFTGYEPDAGEQPCPATVGRPIDIINQWPGNRTDL